MSEKNRDEKGRWRRLTIAFRVSPEENAEIEARYRLCGYDTKQSFLSDSARFQKVVAKGNPKMMIHFKKYLEEIRDELRRINTVDDVPEELFMPIMAMLQILKAFEESPSDLQ